MDPDIQHLARAFVDGELSSVDLHIRLSERRSPISSDIEGDLWGLAFEVGDGDLSLDEARGWLADKYGLNRRSSESDSANPS